MIIGAGPLGLHARNLATIYNYRHLGALHIMNMGEEGEL